MRNIASRLFLVLLISVQTGCEYEEVCPKDDCSDYTCENAAQDDLKDLPEACASLDEDDNGEACDEPGNEVIPCPDSAACGCSNLNKSECNTSCCSWVVGDGCGCRSGVCQE